ncbi:uncharacterized protein LOC116256334 isoform X3 [Nymphaea colorata]|uniref:uncharacterized protein LOC116256334 isoform X3 n=1 Tax=Nymphaea colorata TaxID=210225 RepID=UPI00214E5DBE|nr:uncharacterized protein LOC116256334 isoform X3 [Nymphaea colorata]
MPTGARPVCVDEGDDDLWCEDSASDGYRDDGRDGKSELDREWKRRQNQFHTVSRSNLRLDGLMAGKEASAQEGFNAGFRESVMAGYNWGLVRGITRKPLDSGPDSSGDLIQPNVLGDASYCGKLESFKEKLKSVVSESPASGIIAVIESNIAG